jgi:hypothetical protein
MAATADTAAGRLPPELIRYMTGNAIRLFISEPALLLSKVFLSLLSAGKGANLGWVVIPNVFQSNTAIL